MQREWSRLPVDLSQLIYCSSVRWGWRYWWETGVVLKQQKLLLQKFDQKVLSWKMTTTTVFVLWFLYVRLPLHLESVGQHLENDFRADISSHKWFPLSWLCNNVQRMKSFLHSFLWQYFKRSMLLAVCEAANLVVSVEPREIQIQIQPTLNSRWAL